MSLKRLAKDSWKRIEEGFDRDHPMARVVRDLTPGEREMSPQSRERMMSRLHAVQGEMAEGERPATRRGVHWQRLAIAGVAVAALIAVLLVFTLPGGKKVTPPKQFAKLDVEMGNIEVRGPVGRWRVAEDGEKLAKGWHIRTGIGSFASVEFPEGSIMRVTDGSEAVVKSLGARSVALEHLRGGTYHRVHKGTRYTVWNQGVAMQALGTAFNVESRVPGSLEIVTVESAVKVEVGNQVHKVAQGEVAVVEVDQGTVDKQPVSRERLEEDRLYKNAKQDAEEGYNTGVYEEVSPPLSESSEPQAPGDSSAPAPPALPAVSLGGAALENSVTLEWGVPADIEYDSIVLLRSEGADPVYPDNEIARYSDISIKSATDDGVVPGHAYQYSIYALNGQEVVAFSNPVTVAVTGPDTKPEPASISLMMTSARNSVMLAWTATGATGFDGFVIERVAGPPLEDPTAGETTKTIRIDSSAVSYSYTDTDVQPGRFYKYRVGILVDGAVTVYSNSEAGVVGP